MQIENKSNRHQAPERPGPVDGQGKLGASLLSEPEMIVIAALVCALVLMRGALPAQLGAYVAQSHDALPFTGCERALFDTVIAALGERGLTTDEIAEFIESHALVAGVGLSVG